MKNKNKKLSRKRVDHESRLSLKVLFLEVAHHEAVLASAYGVILETFLEIILRIKVIMVLELLLFFPE
jgi:hypothetical protein